MWIPFGLIGLMPISLLVFANPNQGILEKQSDIFNTTIQKVNARQSRHYEIPMSCALMANSLSFSILQINVTSSKYSNTKSRAHYVIADL